MRFTPGLGVLALVALLAGCASAPPLADSRVRVSTLKPGELESQGIAFITPSTITGREQDRQAVALIFADTFAEERPKAHMVTLAETLSAVNRANLADAYRQMFDGYRETGLFPSEALRRVGAATGTRYIGHLNLQRFEQFSKSRFSIPLVNIRFLETQIGHVRLFSQIWDTTTGTIAWEAVQERVITSEKIVEAPILQHTLIRAAARDLIGQLP